MHVSLLGLCHIDAVYHRTKRNENKQRSEADGVLMVSVRHVAMWIGMT